MKLLLLASLLFLSAYEQALASEPAQAAVHTVLVRFAEIDPGLARGAKPSDTAIPYLASRGYRTVVAFIHDPAEAERVRAAGMRYVEIPMTATIFGASIPTDQDLERFFGVVLDSTARPVYMHCVHGKDRTGAMAALYRIEVSGWKNERALAEMDSLGFNGMYRTLRRYVRDYQPRGYVTRRKMVRVD
ncbi:MAG TPA: tyrosine-protein phosphatase [Candidatus Eisenbacteria bacterium]|nr:tyrosine-protein phosphatase [Candidatus Eisenbacteria bacterium]